MQSPNVEDVERERERQRDAEDDSTMPWWRARRAGSNHAFVGGRGGGGTAPTCYLAQSRLRCVRGRISPLHDPTTGGLGDG